MNDVVDEEKEEIKERPFILAGSTAKIKIPTKDGEFSFYITINKHEDKLYEIFSNCKNAEYTEHMTAITVMISTMLQEGIDIEKIVENLTTIHSPITGHFNEGGWCPSLYARIGRLLAAKGND